MKLIIGIIIGWLFEVGLTYYAINQNYLLIYDLSKYQCTRIEGK